VLAGGRPVILLLRDGFTYCRKLRPLMHVYFSARTRLRLRMSRAQWCRVRISPTKRSLPGHLRASGCIEKGSSYWTKPALMIALSEKEEGRDADAADALDFNAGVEWLRSGTGCNGGRPFAKPATTPNLDNCLPPQRRRKSANPVDAAACSEVHRRDPTLSSSNCCSQACQTESRSKT